MARIPEYSQRLRDYMARHPNEPLHFRVIAKAVDYDANIVNTFLAARHRGNQVLGPLRHDPVLRDIIRVAAGTYAYQPDAGVKRHEVLHGTAKEKATTSKPTCAIERGDLLEVGHVGQDGRLVLLSSNGCTYVGALKEVPV